MATVHKYFKNSNTGDLIMSQSFTDTVIKFPVYWYRGHKCIGEDLKFEGYVEVSEKKYNRDNNKLNKKLK